MFSKTINIHTQTNLEMPKVETPKTGNIFQAVGRRKEASARVRLQKGKGQFVINGRPIAQYFPNEAVRLEKPFKITETQGMYFATIKVEGSGKAGQLDAMIAGIANALSSIDVKKYRPSLKKKGFMTRDPRTRERRMVGKGGKSRRGKQSPKR